MGDVNGVADLAGNPLDMDNIWSFTITAATGDTTPPTVIAVQPADGAVGREHHDRRDRDIQRGHECQRRSSTPPLNCRRPAARPYLAVVAYNSATNTAILTPDSPLSNNTTYTAVVRGGSGGVSDVVGNELATDVSWSFNTAVSSDTTPPFVNSTSPADGATGVSIGTQVVAIFSEAMDPDTITTTTFTVNGVAAAVAYDDTTNTATLTPAAALANATTYTARLSKGGAPG